MSKNQIPNIENINIIPLVLANHYNSGYKNQILIDINQIFESISVTLKFCEEI